MAVIERLSPDVASRIAAGEVVERPFNVVKELMENAVDAGAGKITVEIADGGLSFIRITDDGKGMEPEDLPLALERFATSKARTVEDVYSATTFGFRGEALAAVSAVSDFTLRSGTSSGKAFEIRSRFGVVGAVKPAQSIYGTMAEVLNLFENLPARRKFLKSFRSLEAEIAKLVRQFSLINPGVEVILYSGGKSVYEAFAQEDVSIRAAKVFTGKGFCKGVLEYGQSKVTVAATLPSVSDRLKRDCIVIGVNGRLIKDQSLMQAVIQAYHRLIPDGRFPAAVVDIRIKPDELDANVHPAKLEVRFEKPRDIFCLVTDAIAKSFEGKGIGVDYDTVAEEAQRGPYLIEERPKPKPKEEITIPSLTEIPEQKPVYIEPQEDIPVVKEAPVQKVPDIKVIGQAADMYIICESETGDLLFIDQHAAHERILFEKAQAKDRESKVSIVLHDPVEVVLTEEQFEGAFENSEIIENFGYSFCKSGGFAVEITRVPHRAIRKNIASVFEKIVSELCVSGRSKTEDAPRALLSCKAAIKAGDRLTHTEMEYLTDLLFNTANYGTCPHGRPIIYKMTFTELSRKFLR